MQLKKSLIITLFLLAILTPLTPALAGPTDPSATTVTLVNPLGGTTASPKGLTDIRVLLGNIIAGAMGFVGSVVLAVFVYGGFLWLTSAGNTEQVAKGTNTMLWAAIGLFLIFGAYAILSLVLEAIGAKGGSAPVVPAITDVPAAEEEVQECICYEINEEGEQTGSPVKVKEFSTPDTCEVWLNATNPDFHVGGCKWQ